MADTASGENRRSGMLLDEDFNVYEDQKETDEELSKAALQGLLFIFLLLSRFGKSITV